MIRILGAIHKHKIQYEAFYCISYIMFTCQMSAIGNIKRIQEENINTILTVLLLYKIVMTNFA